MNSFNSSSKNSSKDSFNIGGQILDSRLLIGTAMYESPAIMQASIEQSQSQIVTVSLRRQLANNGIENNEAFWQFLQNIFVKNKKGQYRKLTIQSSQ